MSEVLHRWVLKERKLIGGDYIIKFIQEKQQTKTNKNIK